MELVNLNNKCLIGCQLTLPLGSTNAAFFVYVLLLLRSPGIHFVTRENSMERYAYLNIF